MVETEKHVKWLESSLAKAQSRFEELPRSFQSRTESRDLKRQDSSTERK